ncbi:MAG: hypothetical protein HC900_11465 [Methylacidiphilales bacterium]|nr:hypothetical protein [Candidatus Methylacidiphilales bacterium]
MSDNDWPRAAPTSLGQFFIPRVTAVTSVAATTILFGLLYVQTILPALLVPAFEWFYGLVPPQLSAYLGAGVPMLVCTGALFLSFRYIKDISIRLYAHFNSSEPEGRISSTIGLLATTGIVAALAICYGYILANIAAWVDLGLKSEDKGLPFFAWMIGFSALIITQLIVSLIPPKALINIRYLWLALHSLVVLGISVYFAGFCHALLLNAASETIAMRWALFVVAAVFEGFVLFSWYKLLGFIRRSGRLNANAPTVPPSSA